MRLRILTYTSRAPDGLGGEEIERIHASAMTLNALDGITGMLVFNGTHFLQIIEGADDAIEDLLRRLRADARHFDLMVREDRTAETRSFPDWSMALTRVSRGRFEAKQDIARALPENVGDHVRTLIVDMADFIST